MQKTTTLTMLRRFFGKAFPIVALLIGITFSNANAQVYNNGNLGTGTLSKSGVAAPAGTQWHEMQNDVGNTTQTNVSIAFDCSPILGSSRVADNFTVPATDIWNISKMTFYAVVLPPPPGTSPVTAVRVVIRNASPVGASTVIFGDLTTNRLSSTSFSNIYTIANSQVPAPGTVPNQNFVVWKVEADVPVSLTPGNYWVEWQLVGGAGQRVFALMSQPVGARTAAGYNAVSTFNGGPWTPTLDAGNPASAPDVPVDFCFGVNYTVSPCTSPTASVLSQVGYPTPAVNVINETFTTAAPLPAGWAQQNLSTPAGTNPLWFQGNTGVFAGNTPPGYIAANFNGVGGANTISNWLFAPNITMKNGDSLTFFTRTVPGPLFPDRLQVRRSQNGASTNVGATNTSVGDFTDLLLDINPTYTTTGYPNAWTKFTVVMAGLPPAGVSGRIAFRYFVENGGPAGANSDYIGLDDVVYRTPGANNPPNTCLGSTANLKVDITGGIAPYTVTINTVPPTTPIVVNNYQSGANIPITPTATTQYTLTSVVGCGVGTGNSGTPTVVVSPATFPPIFINALPSGAICAGDPTLLTVGAPPIPVNYTQTGTAPFVGINSQKFEPANAAFDNQAADDFTVPAGPAWQVTQVNVGGVYFNGPGPAASLNVTFYNNSGTNLPGTVVAAFTNVTTFTGGPNFNITLPSAVSLPGGATYWVSVQVNQNFTPAGQWGWNTFGTTNIGFERAWQNPGGGFGTPCTNWGYGATGCGVGTSRNHSFAIIGNIPGGPLGTGYTFQWTPATGLSNPTSNPVAASPMNTTTYTVLVTAPGGCQGTATRTVIVNQPPAITTQPANAVICATGSTSFSIVATGAGPLTYQWEEQVGGVGPWNPLANVAPYSGVNTPTLNINPATGILSGNRYRCVVTGICNPAATSNPATLTVNALPVVPITPAGPVCGGVAGINGTQLTAGSVAPPIPGSVTFTSSTPIPIVDNTPAGTSGTITVSGVPANATITGIRTTINGTHTWLGDVVMVLKAPGTLGTLNLDYYLNNTGAGPTTNFVNTTFSSASTTAIGTASPFTGVFRADGVLVPTAPVSGPAGPTGMLPTVSSYAALIGAINAGGAGAANGTYTLGVADNFGGDFGTVSSWSIAIDYTTPGTGTGAVLTYVWSPVTGLYNDPAATVAYTGTDRATVYAAPTTFTVYTVTATNTATGCVGTNRVAVNYTPPAPNVTPNPVSMCLGAPAVMLRSSSSTSTTVSFTSGAINVPILDNTPTGASSTIAVTGIPNNASITGMKATVNGTHTWLGDVVMVLKAPGTLGTLNLDYYLGNTGAGPTTNFVGTAFGSAPGLPTIGTASPFTGTFKADGITGPTAPVGGPAGPAGMLPTVNSYNALMAAINAGGPGAGNGTYTLGIADYFGGDAGVLTRWDLEITYTVGVPATPAVWSPATHLYSNAAATVAYVAGTPVDSVWVKPTPFGVYNYDVTVNSIPVPDPANTAPIAIPSVGNGNPYPSVISVFGYPNTGVAVANVKLNGVSHTWGDDIDVLLQSPSGTNVILMSDVGGTVAVPNANYTFVDGANAMNPTAANPTGTYRPTNNGATDNFPAPGPGSVTQATPTLALFGNTANVNGDWKLFVVDDVAGDLGSISGGWSISFNPGIAPCTSPARRVVVTVRDTVKIITNPVSTSSCITTGTNTSATFRVVATGDALTYQWQTAIPSVIGGLDSFVNLANGVNYAGVTTATLTINNPPVSWNGKKYRVVVSGSCGSKIAPDPNTLAPAILTVPSVTLTVSGLTKLHPGLTTTLVASASPTPLPSPLNYEWYRNGALVTTTVHPINSLVVNVDGLGDYTVKTVSGAGCANISNMVTISDSASGKVFVYPNPNNGIFQVRYYSTSDTRSPRGINVYDDKGSRIAINQFSNTAPYTRMDIDLRKHGKGIYWVEVVDRNGERLAVGRAVVL
jgi:subtilisin-like proprotein convertase family protein